MTIPADTNSSTSLIPAVARGDVDAFEALYDRHAPSLFAQLIQILGSSQQAAEVLQESFVQAWNSADRFAPAFSEFSWLASICRNRGLDRVRSRRMNQESGQPEEISEPSSNVSITGSPGDRGLDQVTARKTGHLAVEERRALELAYFQGLAQGEIAAKLDQTGGSIRAQLLSGMTKLRSGMKQSGAK